MFGNFQKRVQDWYGWLKINAGSTTQPALEVAQTWNDPATVFTGVKLNFTLKNQADNSRYLDILVGGTSICSVRRMGPVNRLIVDEASNATGSVSWWSSGFSLGSMATLAFKTYTDGTGPDALNLRMDAAHVFAQRLSTNAQTYRLYNTYTDASNYERLAFAWSSNLAEIKTEAAGTGTLRGLSIGSTSGTLGFLGATPVVRQAHVADADTAHALNATFSDTEVEAALNALAGKINSILATLEAFGLHATS